MHSQPMGTSNSCTAFAEEYPLEGICEMLGIPSAKRASFYGYASDFGLIFSQTIGLPEVRAKAEAALAALYACADEVIAAARAKPGDDLVSALVAAESDGDRLTTAELRAMIAGLVFAGNDTTRNQIALGMIAFSEHPEQWTLLRERPDLTLRAVDEMMRLHPTISVVPRVVHEECEYNGMTFKRGMFVALVLASANADERVFGDAPFDIAAERPASHLTFSGGMHRCLGMWLARAEMQEALDVLERAGSRKSLKTAEPTWIPGLGIDGPSTAAAKVRSLTYGLQQASVVRPLNAG